MVQSYKLVPVGGAPSGRWWWIIQTESKKSSPLKHLTLTERWDSCVWGVRQPVAPWLLFIGSFSCCQVRRLLTWREAPGLSWQVILKVRESSCGAYEHGWGESKKGLQAALSFVCVFAVNSPKSPTCPNCGIWSSLMGKTFTNSTVNPPVLCFCWGRWLIGSLLNKKVFAY